MQFGIVYGFNSNGNPMVQPQSTNGRVKRKQEASNNYLIIAGTREGSGYEDSKISAAIDWYNQSRS